MANYFDQFDEKPQEKQSNYFDQFDGPNGVVERTANDLSAKISDLTKGPFQPIDLESMAADPEWAKQNIAALPENEREAGIKQVTNAINMRKAYDAANTSYAKDVMLSIPSGVARGIAGLASLPNIIERGGRWAVGNKSPAKSPSYEQLVNEEERLLGTELYEPKTVPGQYANTIGEFLPSLPLGGAGTTLAGKVGARVVAPAVVSESAGQATKGTVAEPYARLAGALAGGMVPGALKKPEFTLPEVTAAAERQNIPVPRGATASLPVRTIAAKAADIPIIGAPLKTAANRTIEGLGQRAEDIASELGSGQRASAAPLLREDLSTWTKETSADIANKAYEAVDNIIDPNVTNPLTNTKSVVDDLLKSQQASTSTTANRAIGVVEDAVNRQGGLTYEGLKNLRTDVGNMISGTITPEPGTSQPALKRLYGALTNDLEETVKKAGGESGYAAWKSANETAKVIAEKRASLTKILGAKGDVSPEGVYARVKALAGSTATADIEKLKLVKDTVGQSSWNDFASSIVNDLGQSPKVGFSADKFMTNYSKLSNEAKDVMFSKPHRQALDDIATISQRSAQLYRMGNPSGTAGAIAQMSAISGMIYNPMHTIGTIAGGGSLSWFLSRPSTAKSIARYMRTIEAFKTGATTRAAVIAATKDLESELAPSNGDKRLIQSRILRNMQK